MWYTKFWAFSALWKQPGVDTLRPTENAAFKELYYESVYASYLRIGHG